MSTTVDTPPPVETPTRSPRDITPREARAILTKKEPLKKQLLRLGIILLSLVVLVRGWMVTDIDLKKLANAPNAAPILKALVQPDVFDRDVTQTQLEAPFTVGVTGTEPVESSTRTGQT
ncbi:MAG TPA: hypothetical protein VFG86_02405, partial [Chloroflexota bacterium]|nr:hypothetical protein [Chloroflexota bacterium]